MRQISLVDIQQGSQQRVDNWFRDASLQLYGDAFSVYSTSAQSIPDSSNTKVTAWNNTEYSSGCFSTGSDFFVASITGLFYFDCQLTWFGTPGPGKTFRLMFYKNGNEIARREVTTDGAFPPWNTLSSSIFLSKGDRVEVYVWQDSGGFISLWDPAGGSGQVRQRFSGFLIRPI